MAKTTCRYCGHKIEQGATVCPKCKRSLVDTCPIDGTRIYSNEDYCPTCGASVRTKCSKCNEDLFIGEKFCPFCGTKNAALSNLLLANEKTNADTHEDCTKKCEFPQWNFPQYNFGSFNSTPFSSFGTNPYFGFGSPFYGFGNNLNTFSGFNGFGKPLTLPETTQANAEVEPEKKEEPATVEEPVIVENATERENRKKDSRVRPNPDEEQPVKKSKLGIVGFVLSIISIILPFLIILSIPISAVAIKKDKAHKKLAIAGLIIGLIILLAIVAVVVWALAFEGLATIKDIIEKFLGLFGLEITW